MNQEQMGGASDFGTGGGSTPLTPTAHPSVRAEGEARGESSKDRGTPHPSASSRLYGTEFWLVYLANFLMTGANALLFRFADFVVLLQGSAVTAGLVVGIATGVSVPARIWAGRLIDRRGPRYVWAGCAILFVVSCLAFLQLHALGPAIYLARIGFACGIAGMFACSIVYMCTGVPAVRRAELIGTVGTSGFLGMVLGPLLGDWIFRTFGDVRKSYDLMFLLAAAMGIAYLVVVLCLRPRTSPRRPKQPPPVGWLILRHWPGTVAAVAMMMGLGLAVTGTFLTRFRVDRDLGGMGTFFLFYAPTAFLMRIIGRRWPERFGRRKAVLIGLMCMAISMLLYLLVRSEWQLVWPAVAAGMAHALLFPSVTTLGADSFPERYRATGTALVLGMVDLGTLCSAPVLGAIIDHSGFAAMFVISAGIVAAVAICFAIESLARWRRAGLLETSRAADQPLPVSIDGGLSAGS